MCLKENQTFNTVLQLNLNFTHMYGYTHAPVHFVHVQV